MEMIKSCHLTKFDKWLSHEEVRGEACMEDVKNMQECLTCDPIVAQVDVLWNILLGNVQCSVQEYESCTYVNIQE